MPIKVLLAVLLAWSCAVAADARAGTVAGGTAPAGNDSWSIEEIWTDGTTTFDLKISGFASIGYDVLPLLENFIKADFAGTNFHLVTGGAPSTPPTDVPTPPTPAASDPTPPASTPSTPALDPPPIAPVPEPSGAVLAVSGLGALVFAIRRRV